MNSQDHAMLEFKAAGWIDENDNWTDDWQQAICENVLNLLMLFSNQGHSGASAPYTIKLFEKLAMFEPIVPLTGEDWEWSDVRHNGDGSIHYQNKRCSHVFKEGDGQVYDIEGKVFWEWYKDQETGEAFKSYYTSRDSRVYVTFPYTPNKEYVYRYSDAEPQGPKQNEDGLIDD
jgi:hypothetical protein